MVPAARLEDHGGESWQQPRRLVEEGRREELFPGPARDVDQVVEKVSDPSNRQVPPLLEYRLAESPR